MYRYALYLQLNNGVEGYYYGEYESGIPRIERDQAYGFPSEAAAKAKVMRMKTYLEAKYSKPNIVYWEIVRMQ